VPGDSAVIRFNADSSFCYNDNFPWSFAHYDKFVTLGNFLWLYPSPSGPGVMGAAVILEGNNELVLIRHGVDTGVRERYKRQ
jgi:hypothetical protein